MHGRARVRSWWWVQPCRDKSFDAYGVHLRVVGSARLRSPAALGFDPLPAAAHRC